MAQSKIRIKPNKRGTFTAAASKRGKSVQAFASQVLSNKDNYSPVMVKKANFARNAAKWNHEDGGIIPEYGLGGDILGGAASGVAAGSSFGPWGAAIGGLIGGIGGLFGGKKREAAEEEFRQKQKEAVQFAQGRERAYAEYTPNMQYTAMFANGGEVDITSFRNGKVPFESLPLIQDPLDQSIILHTLSNKYKDTYEIGKANSIESDKKAGKYLKDNYDFPYSHYTTVKNKKTGTIFYQPVLTEKEQQKIAIDRGLGVKKFPDGGEVTGGNFTALDKRIARTVAPRGYSNDPAEIWKALKGFISGETTSAGDDLRDEIWRYSLGSNEELKHFENSPYKPTKGSQDMNYLRAKNLDRSPDMVKNILAKLQAGETSSRRALPLTQVNQGAFDVDPMKATYKDPQLIKEMFSSSDVLGNYTLGQGEDESGKYVSIYDKWDLANPIANSYLDRIPEIYDRIYYSQDEQGNINVTPEEMACGGKVKRKMAIGGVAPNVELEGGESFETPNGENFNVEGPSHANGGVPMNLEGGTRVYSDRLRLPGSKQTFSAANKKLAKKISKFQETLENPKATALEKRTAERMLGRLEKDQNDLFVTQERLKHTKGFPAKKEFADGGLTIDPWMGEPNAGWGIEGQQWGNPNITVDAGDFATASGNLAGNNLMPFGQRAKGFLGSVNLGAGLTKAATALPAIYNIGQGLFGKPDVENPMDYSNVAGMAAASRLRGRKYNIDPMLEANRRAYATAQGGLRGAARTRGELLSGYGALAAGRSAADSTAYAQKQNMENQYLSESAQMEAQLGAQEAATRMGIADRNLANRAAQRRFLTTGLSQVSNIAQAGQRERNLRTADEMRVEALGSILPNFIIDPTTGRIKYKPQ